MSELLPNPDGCERFSSNVFKKERCRNCGHPWYLHKDAIDPSLVAAFSQSRQQAEQVRAANEVEVKAKLRAKARAKKEAQQAVEDTWFLDGELENDSPGDDQTDGDVDVDDFRMLSAQDIAGGQHMAAPSSSSSDSSAPRSVKVVNFIDFDECNVLLDRPPSSSISIPSASPSRRPPISPATPPSMRPEPGFNMSMESKEDVLLEEIQYLRQMLADSNEERNIQVAIAREEMQRIVGEVTGQRIEAEAALRSVRKELQQLRSKRESGPRWSRLLSVATDQQQREENLAVKGDTLDTMKLLLDRRAAELDRREEDATRLHDERKQELSVQCAGVEERSRQLQAAADVMRRAMGEAEASTEAMRGQLAARDAELATRDAELRWARERLAWWEAPADALASAATVPDIVAWEQELRDEAQHVLSRIADRRVELCVAAIAQRDVALCKICFDRPAACALLPCRHHAFCMPCGDRVQQSQKPMCPLCRSSVTGLLETFAG